MELWVRSQSKIGLYKIDNVYIHEDEDKTIHIWADGINKYLKYYLGSYKSKQRALEIIDEIQNILKPVIITTGYECDIKDNPIDKTCFNLEMIPNKTEIQQITSYVYEMPAE